MPAHAGSISQRLHELVADANDNSWDVKFSLESLLEDADLQSMYADLFFPSAHRRPILRSHKPFKYYVDEFEQALKDFLRDS